MIRAVIDTNVLVSGLITPSGYEALIILACHQGLVRPCLSPEIITEYAGVLARPKFAFPPDQIDALMVMLRSRVSWSNQLVVRLLRPIQVTPSS